MTLDRPFDGISAGSQLAAELWFGSLALIALGYCLWLARRERKIWPLMVLLAGAPMTMWEPMQNIVTHVVYPEDGAHVAFTIYDRPMPVFLVLLYVAYFGLWVPWLMKKFEDGVSVKQVMKFYFVTVLFAAAFEPVPVHFFKWYRYYGDNQPLQFFGIPIWWFFVNALAVVGVAVVFAALRKHVLTADWQSVFFIPAGLLVCAGLHQSAGVPVYAAIGSGWSSAVTIPASLLSSAIAVVWVYLLARLVAVPTIRHASGAVEGSITRDTHPTPMMSAERTPTKR
jgi:hypothetical protein